MTVDLSPDQTERLNQLASTTGRTADELVREAIENLLAYNAWFDQEVQAGLDQITRGETITNEEVRARIEKRFPG